MGVVISGGQSRVDPVQTYKLLDQFLTVLGSTKTSFWPLVESTGAIVRTYGESAHIFTMTDSGANGFHPVEHPGRIQSYHFSKSDDQHGAGQDHADFSFGNGTTTDAAVSWGAWVWQDVQGAAAAIMTKYDAVGTDREWSFMVNASNKLELELYDDNANASEAGMANTALTLNQFQFVVITYNGAQADPDVNFYLDGAADGSGTTQTGSYEAMQAGATPVMLGAEDDTAAPTNEFNGRIALPFVCGKELSAAEVTTLYGIGKTLLGV